MIDSTILFIIFGIATLLINIWGNARNKNKDDNNNTALLTKISTTTDFMSNDIKDMKAENKLIQKDFDNFKFDTTSKIQIIKNDITTISCKVKEIEKERKNNEK